MSITLDGLSLPDDLVWVDEFDHSDVVQNQQRSLSGALLIQESVKLHGRSINLRGDETSGWTVRASILLIQAKVDTVDHDMVLSFHGVDYDVRFNRNSGASPISAKPIKECTDPAVDAPYSLTISLMTV